MEPNSNWIHQQNTPIPQDQGILLKRSQKDFKSQRIWEFAVRLCLLLIVEAIPIKSHKHDCPNLSWTRITPMDMTNWMGERPQPYTEIYKLGWCLHLLWQPVEYTLSCPQNMLVHWWYKAHENPNVLLDLRPTSWDGTHMWHCLGDQNQRFDCPEI